MRHEPIQVLQAATRPWASSPKNDKRLLIAGATGAMGGEVLRRLVGSGAYASTCVLGLQPVAPGLRSVEVAVMPEAPIAAWPLVAADTGVILFDPPRLF